MDSVLSFQTEDFTWDGKNYLNYWSRRTDQKLFSQTTRWNLGEHLWNHRTSTPHRSETNGIAERAVRRVKEGTSPVLLQSGLDEKWWSGSRECYCYLRNVQDLLADGKTPYERRFGEPFKRANNTFWINGWISSDFTEWPSKNSSIWQESVTWNLSWLAGGIWKGDILIADLEDLEKLNASDICTRITNAKEVLIRQKRWWIHIPICRWYSKNCQERDYEFRILTLRREPTVRSEDLSGEIHGEPWVSTDRIHRWRWSPCRPLVDPRWLRLSSPQWTSSSTLCAEGRNIDDYWNVDSSRHLSDSWKDSPSSSYWKKNLQKDTCGPGGDWQRFKRLPDQIIYGQKFGPTLVKLLRIEKNRNGQEKNQSSTMLEEWEEFTLSIQVTQSTKKSSKTWGENWKDLWHKPCRGKDYPTASRKCLHNRRLHPRRLRKRFVVEQWNLVNPQSNEWNLLSPNITKTTWQAKDPLRCRITNKFIPMPQGMKNPDAKAAVDKKWKKLETIPARRRLFWKHKETKKKVHFATDGHMSPQKWGVGTKITEIQRQSRPPRGPLWKTTLEPMQLLLNRARLRPIWMLQK